MKGVTYRWASRTRQAIISAGTLTRKEARRVCTVVMRGILKLHSFKEFKQ